MKNKLDKILQLCWMDGAKLSGGSYINEKSIPVSEANKMILNLFNKYVTNDFKRLSMEILDNSDGNPLHEYFAKKAAKELAKIILPSYKDKEVQPINKFRTNWVIPTKGDIDND